VSYSPGRDRSGTPRVKPARTAYRGITCFLNGTVTLHIAWRGTARVFYRAIALHITERVLTVTPDRTIIFNIAKGGIVLFFIGATIWDVALRAVV
jgi:hypothetical protein